jgi:hypothetical protein
VKGVVGAGGDLLRAEVTFRPAAEKPGLPSAAVTLITKDVPSDADQLSDGASNFLVRLPQDTTFDVSIQPLGAHSESFPPKRMTWKTRKDPATTFRFVYDQLEDLPQRLVDDVTLAPVALSWVRLVDADSGSPISSSMRTDADGAFVLHALSGTLGDERYLLEVGLGRHNPWDEVIRVPAARIDASGQTPVAIPAPPARVLYQGQVETKKRSLRAPGSQLTFTSSFPVPAGISDVGNRDWCRSHVLADQAPPFSCAARPSVVADDAGNFSIELFPGDYDVYFTSGADPTLRKLGATNVSSRFIETPTSSEGIAGIAFQLSDPLLLSGSLVTPHNSATPRVDVSVLPLALEGLLGNVARYSQLSETTTDAEGKFSAGVDVGYYDFLAEPPHDSNYPALLVPNRGFGPALRPEYSVRGLMMPLPLVLSGTLRDAESGSAIAGAQIDAFILVDDRRTKPPQRGALVAQTKTDDKGHYTLLLQPRIPEDK